MAESVFPADHFRRISADDHPISWSADEVDQAIDIHVNLERIPDIDECVADLWKAASYLILAREIWEGWLVDWKNWLDDSQNSRPDPEVPTQLFEYCAKAVEVLTYGGAFRTKYVDHSVNEILSRFPPNGQFELWSKEWAQDCHFYHECCTKVSELVPLEDQLVRLLQHFESSPDSALAFQIVRLGTRSVGNFPGTFLDVYVGFEPHEGEPTGDDAKETAEFKTVIDDNPPPEPAIAPSAEKKPKLSTELGDGQPVLRLLNVFTNGIADERIKTASNALANDRLNSNEKLTKIDELMSIPPTASSQQLGDMLGVSKQAVMKTKWWEENRKGEKDDVIGHREAQHRERAKQNQPNRKGDDDD